ncbi:MAG: amidohydrolase family protein, partial [Flavitalea sp.]
YTWIDDSMKMLRKDYLPNEIELVLKRNNVDGCVAVQAVASELETRFLAELSNTHPIIKAVVGWTDLRANDLEKKLTDLSAYSSIKGLRHIVQTEPDDFLYDTRFRDGLALINQYGYSFDLLIYPRQLNAAIDLVKSFPLQNFILDHAGKPAIRKNEMDEWKKGITELASYENVSCKLSGLITEAKWKEWRPADFYPYLDVLFEIFSAERLLFGSDWPVMLISGIYVQWKSLLEKYMEHALPEDREKVFGENAKRLYRI